ncbi:SPOR domain-containing protein [Porticoccaceae bacterium LTM1]|nr:SPOR domain-containing protein [Porticoccaceae bacterium LTM1]
MSRDYARSSSNSNRRKPSRPNARRAPAKKSQKGSSKMFWFLSGGAVGALVTAMILQPEMREDVTDMVADMVPTQKSDKPADNKPKLVFYERLSEDEVRILEDEVARQEAAQVTRPVNSPKPETKPIEIAQPTDSAGQSGQPVYILQAGSFATHDDASGRRAQLLLMNLDASIEKGTIQSGATRYRVMVGPFANHSEMARARSTLSANGIDTLPLKRKL